MMHFRGARKCPDQQEIHLEPLHLLRNLLGVAQTQCPVSLQSPKAFDRSPDRALGLGLWV